MRHIVIEVANMTKDENKVKKHIFGKNKPKAPEELGVQLIEKREVPVNKDRHKKQVTAIVAFLVLATILAVYLWIQSISYNGYEVIDSTDITEYSSLQYAEYMDNLIKYSKDGATYFNKKGNSVWSESYNMKMPHAVVSGEYVAIADLNGNQVCILDADGKVSSVNMPYAIRDIDIADQGVFAVVLENSTENYINLYDKNGELITEIQTTINKSGYPLDITLSNDGKKLFTSYLYMDGVEVKNGLAAYNFGSVGQNENSDRLMGGYKFEDTIIPKVEFLNTDTICAFGDNQFVLYSMKEKPSKKAEINFDEPLRSIFNNNEYIGVVYDNKDKSISDKYVLQVYNINGKTVLKKTFNNAYNNIHMVDDQIVIIGDTDCIIFNMKGNVKFKYSFKDKVVDMIPNGAKNEYVLLHETKLETIRLRLKDKNKETTEDVNSNNDSNANKITTEESKATTIESTETKK